jgi:hypothetical protein
VSIYTTDESFVNAVYERLRAMNPSIEPSVIPRLSTMVLPALESLSQKVGRDRTLRNLLRKSLGTVTASSGVASLATLQTGTQPILLDEVAIRSADIRDADGNKLQMLADRASLNQDRPDSFKYGAVEGQTLYTDADGTLTVLANYIETEIANLPGQLVPLLFEEMFSPWTAKVTA